MIQAKRVKKFKWIWAWQDEAEEKWLREMSQKDYHLVSVDFAGTYSFEIGLPRDYIYRLDTSRTIKRVKRKDMFNYLRMPGRHFS